MAGLFRDEALARPVFLPGLSGVTASGIDPGGPSMVRACMLPAFQCLAGLTDPGEGMVLPTFRLALSASAIVLKLGWPPPGAPCGAPGFLVWANSGWPNLWGSAVSAPALVHLPFG